MRGEAIAKVESPAAMFHRDGDNSIADFEPELLLEMINANENGWDTIFDSVLAKWRHRFFVVMVGCPEDDLIILKELLPLGA
jgi:hypothetical protein